MDLTVNGFIPKNPPNESVLREALKDQDPKVRAFAADIFSAFSPSEVETERALLQALQDPVPRVRTLAAQAEWSALGFTPLETVRKLRFPALLEGLNDPDPTIRFELIGHLMDSDPRSFATTAAEVLANDSVAFVTASAFSRLSLLCEQGDYPEACETLSKALYHPNPAARLIAGMYMLGMNRLSGFKISDRDFQKILKLPDQALQHPEPFVRSEAIRMIEDYPSLFRTPPSLLRPLQDSDAGIRIQAVEMFLRSGSKAPELLETLLVAMRAPESDIRRRTLGILVNFLSDPRVQVAVERASRDPNSSVRSQATDIVGRDDFPDSEIRNAVLKSALKDADPAPRLGAAEALSRKRFPRLPLQLALVDVVDEPRWSYISERAWDALRQAGALAPSIELTLTSLMCEHEGSNNDAAKFLADFDKRIGLTAENKEKLESYQRSATCDPAKPLPSPGRSSRGSPDPGGEPKKMVLPGFPWVTVKDKARALHNENNTSEVRQANEPRATPEARGR